MTAYSRTQLAAFFQTGDVPTGSDYSNLIDSCLNMVDTSEQQIASKFNAPEVITSRLSAGNAAVVGTLTVGTLSQSNITTGIVSASTVITDALSVSANTSANNIWINGDFYRSVVTIAASGSAIGGANLLTGQISRLTTVTDGTATGVILQANKTGLVQYLYNETATSANLYPCVGGQINVLASSAPFALAGSTLYTIVHTKASGYAVK
jgi:hypothetical protein